jgi:RNA polymerase subunit RPABC4/transcription elongation factor Spt4
MDWEFPDHHEAAWTWPEDNPHAFQVMDDVIPFRSPKGEIKLCPNCGRTVRFSIGMCPLCGYDEEDWQMPEQHIAAAWDNYQDPREPFVDQAGQYHSQCEQCGELIDGPVCAFCGHQQTTQDPQTLLNHQRRDPMDQAGEWTLPEHWANTYEAGPQEWAQRFLQPEFHAQPTNMQGLPGHCSFHPERPAVAHEGFAAMCLECYERYQQAQRSVGHQ